MRRRGVCVDGEVSGSGSVSERLSVDVCGWCQTFCCLDEVASGSTL